MSNNLTAEKHLYFAVTDNNDLTIRMSTRQEAKRLAKSWDKEYPEVAPHRAVEVFAKELT